MQAAVTDDSKSLSLVHELAKDLSQGKLPLPSFPDIVVKIRKTISDESCNTDKIVQVLGAEPVLAARIINISNSAAMRPSTDPITDLRMAVNRIGYKMVRNTTMSYGVTQTEASYKSTKAKLCLRKLWDEASHVAALCFVLTKKCTKLNPDEALLIGLMHSIGKLYILGKTEEHPALLDNEAELVGIMEQWHCPLGSVILKNWGFETYVSSAVASYRNHQRDHGDQADYTDILTMATLFSQFMRAEDDAEFHLNEIPASQQLNIGIEDMVSIIESSNNQINSLRRALGM